MGGREEEWQSDSLVTMACLLELLIEVVLLLLYYLISLYNELKNKVLHGLNVLQQPRSTQKKQ